MAFGDNGVAIAGADKGFIYRSTDGISWSGQQVGNNSVNGIAYAGNGVFLAVESGGHIFRSTNYGLTWAEQLNSGQLWTAHDLTGVAFGYSSTLGAVFVIVATGGQTLYSTDYGVTWDFVDLIQYFPCEVSPYDTPQCTVGPLGPAVNPQGVTFGHDEFVAVADTGAVFVSKDGGQSWAWTFVGPAAAAVPLQGVAYGSGSNEEYFVAVGKNGVTLIGPVDPLTGAISWYSTSFPTTYLRGVTFGENKFAAVGYGASIVQSKPLPW